MSWTTVNVLQSHAPIRARDDPTTLENPDKRDLNLGSKYRADVLTRAEKLVRLRPQWQVSSTRAATSARSKTKTDKNPTVSAARRSEVVNTSDRKGASLLGEEHTLREISSHPYVQKSLDEHDQPAKPARSAPVVEPGIVDPPLNSGSSKFDDFDDTIFDQLTIVTASRISLPDMVFSSSKTIADTGCAYSSDTSSVYPNGAPFPPFMHPCLLDSIDREGIALNRRNAATPSLRPICFRTAELLRISRSSDAIPSSLQYELSVEIFVTVHEVKYAPWVGDLQYFVLGDIFFDKPYITAISRIQYDARGLTSPERTNRGPKAIFKAIIKHCDSRTNQMARSAIPAHKKPVAGVESSVVTPKQPRFEIVEIVQGS